MSTGRRACFTVSTIFFVWLCSSEIGMLLPITLPHEWGVLQTLYQLAPQLVERSISFARNARPLLTKEADTICPKAACSSSSSLFCSFLQGDFEFSEQAESFLWNFMMSSIKH